MDDARHIVNTAQSTRGPTTPDVWAAERTNYSRDVAAMALAQTIGDKVEAAYRRGDLMEKRKRIMDDWAKFCGTVAKAGNVVAINRR